MMLLLFLLITFNPEVTTYKMLGDYYLGMNMLDSAEFYLKEGYEKTKEPSLLKMLVDVYMKRGDLKRTEKLIKKLKKKGIYDADLFQKEIKILLHEGKKNKALKLAQKYERIFSEDSTSVYFLANLYDVLDKKEKALKLYRIALSMKKDSTNILKDYASLLLRSGKLDEARSIYEKLIEEKRADFKVYIGAASLYEKLGQKKKALYYYSKALEIVPDNINIVMKMAQLSLDMGKVNDAIKILNAGKELDPFNLNLRFLLGLAKRRAGDLVGSTEDLMVVTSIDTANVTAYYYISRNFYNIGQMKLALDYIDKALMIEERRDFVLFKAFLLIKQEKPDEAIHLLRTISPKGDPYYYFLMGHAYVAKSEERKSLKYFKKAAELDPQNVNRLATWADVLIDLERKDEALKVLKKALEIEPTNIEILIQYATLLGDIGKIKEADSLFRMASEIDSTNPVIYNNWGYLLAKNGIELERAINLIKKALALDPLNPLYLDSMGWAYFMKGDLSKAKEYLERAYSGGGRDKEILLHLARLYKKLGNFSKAASFYKKVLELDNKNREAREFLKKHE